MGGTDNTEKAALPRGIDDLTRTSVHGTEVPLLRTGQFRPPNGFWLLSSISETNALVLVAQAARRQTARPARPPYEHLESLSPRCYLVSEELWSAICAGDDELAPLSTKIEGRYGARQAREGFHEFSQRSSQEGVHITAGTLYRQAEPWAVVFVPLQWGEEVIRRELVKPRT